MFSIKLQKFKFDHVMRTYFSLYNFLWKICGNCVILLFINVAKFEKNVENERKAGGIHEIFQAGSITVCPGRRCQIHPFGILQRFWQTEKYLHHAR